MKAILQQETGFTLIEAMVAVMILAIGILALNGMQIQSIRGNTSANNLTASSTNARTQIETLLAVPFNDATLSPGGHIQAGNNSPVVLTSWNISEWATDGQDNDMDGRTDEFDEQGIKHVILTVRYLDRGVTKQLTTEFIRSEIF